MGIIPLIIILLVVGFVIYLIQTVPVPIHPWIRKAIIGVIFLFLVIYLLQSFGINTGLHLRLH